jgi:hypothetical protein
VTRGSALLLVLMIGACVPAQRGAIDAERLCEGPGQAAARELAADARLVGTFRASFADVLSWREQRYRTVGFHTGLTWTDLRPLDQIAVCYFDGTYWSLTRAPPSATPLPRERIAILVRADGETALGTYGQRQDTPVTAPPSGP